MSKNSKFSKSLFCPNCGVELEIEDRELNMDRIKCPKCKMYVYRKYFDISKLTGKQKVILRSFSFGIKNKPLITFKNKYLLSIIFMIIGIFYSSVDLMQGSLLFSLSAIYNIKKHRLFGIKKQFKIPSIILEVLLWISLIPSIFSIIRNNLWYIEPVTYLFIPLFVIVMYYQLSNSNPIVRELSAQDPVENQLDSTRNTIIDDDLPVTPMDIIKRMKDVPDILQWSKKKHLIVSGPYFWGVHHIYIDENLNHLIICLKDDRTSHVFIGDVANAKEWRKYDEYFDLLSENDLDYGVLKWKIYKDIVLYKGKMLPPKEIPEEPYWGTLIDYEEFKEEISDSMIVKTIQNLFNLENINP